MGNDKPIEVWSTKDIDLEQILAEIGGGVRLVVRRKEPRWCDGYLDTIEVDADEAYSIEDLRDQYGGRKLEIKVLNGDGKIVARRTVKFPDPPRKNGHTLEPPELVEGSGKGKSMLELFLAQQTAAAETQAKHNEAMLTMVREQAATTQAMLKERLEEQKTDDSKTQNSLREAMEMVEFMEGLRERLGGKREEEINPLHKQILDMGEQFFAFKLDQERMKFETQMAQTQKEEPPPLPERRKTPEKSMHDIGDMEFLTHAAKRFEKMDLSQQQQVAKLFFSKLKTENSGSQKQQPPIKSKQAAKQKTDPTHLEPIEPETIDDDDIDLDPEDIEELRQHAAHTANTET